VSTTVSGVAYAGEWLQLQVPAPIYVNELRMTRHTGANLDGNHVGSIVVAGSNDGVAWSLLSSHLDMPPWTGHMDLSMPPCAVDCRYN
jgi:hypothetical protein